MPQCKDTRKARRKRLFGKISPSTFIHKHKLLPSCSILGKSKSLHSKSTYFYRWGSYVVPSVCGLALLIGGLVTINPDISMGINANSVYANEGTNDNSGIELYTADSAISLTIANDGSFVGNANVDEVSYITNTFTVNVTDHASYTVKMNAMNGSGTELRGRDNAFATIKGVGNKVAPANFASNTWGYSWSENTGANPATLTYSSMPAYGSDESMFTKTLTGTEKNEDYSYLLAFAAKIGDDSPADHYVGNFLLSVVGTAFTPETFTLNYNVNEGTGTIGTQSCTQTQVGGSCKLDITKDEPTRENYTFLGWADTQDATEAQYTPGSSISLNSTNTTLTGDKRAKTLYAIWQQDGTTYQLAYNANGGSGVPGTQSQVSAASSYSFTIPSTTPTRSGYTFRGWSPTTTPITTIYQPGATYTVQEASPSQTLYAVWRSNTIFNGITTMQAMTSTICSSAIEGDEAILTDTRDNKKYYVTKLADGNCWMTQNLAYGTVADTSIGTPCELNGTANGATCTEGTSWSNSNTNKYFAIGKHDDGSHTSQGNFYNWPAAIQGTTGGTNIQGVCPTGWQLPVSNTTTADKSFGKLTTAYGISNNSAGSTALRSEPLYFQYSGGVVGGTLYNAGSFGYYWSSTVNNSSYAYHLDFGSSYVDPSYSSYRIYGFSVRCVAE